MVEHGKKHDRNLEIAQYGLVDEFGQHGLAEVLGNGNVDVRFKLYEFANPKFDFNAFSLGELALQGDESILDVGCSSAKTLIKLRAGMYVGSPENSRYLKHAGRLCGIDASEDSIRAGLDDQKIKLSPKDTPIELHVCYAEELPFEDDEFDVCEEMFVLYHTLDPVRAIKEARRVTKPGGKIAIATSGPKNKIEHRKFEKELAWELGYDPPPIFAASFNSQIADSELNKEFGKQNVKRHRHTGWMEFDSESIDYYKLSLNSMMNAISPTIGGREWQTAMDKVVTPVIDGQIQKNGIFRDYIERDLFICTNDK